MNGKFVTVATFSQVVEAHLARTRLETEGIRCFVRDEHVITVNWLFSNAVGGVKLMVPRWELERARELLRPQPRLVVVADPDAPDAGGELICPRCRSYDVYYHRFNRRIGMLVAAVFGFVLPLLSRRWVCKQCGYGWKEDKSAT